jgi:thiamine biosynthesis lipoprotein
MFIFFICLLIVFTSGCKNTTGQAPANPLAKTNFILGTLIEIKIYDKNNEQIIDEAFSRIAEIENRMTINNAETSEIIQLNNEAGKKEVKVSPDTFYVLEKGKYFSNLSKGIFDISIGPIVKLWNIGTDYAAVPEQTQLDTAIKLVDYNKLQLDKSSYTAKLEQNRMKIDLGAIAKGYAADEAGAILRKNGVKHALISLGGNMLVIGGNPNGNPWKIGIQNPFESRGTYLGVIPVTDKTIVTSGTYERYFEENGKIYHHILNPKTGYPVENDLNSVSIITEFSIDADALSTITLLLGMEEGFKLIESLEGVEAVFVNNDKSVYVTSGLKDSFTIVDNEFTLQN